MDPVAAAPSGQLSAWCGNFPLAMAFMYLPLPLGIVPLHGANNGPSLWDAVKPHRVQEAKPPQAIGACDLWMPPAHVGVLPAPSPRLTVGKFLTTWAQTSLKASEV